MLFGGRVAEELVFGPAKITTGAGNDIERATAMARQMVTRFGMSDIIGLMAIGNADQEVFLGRELVQRREVSEHTAQQVDQEVKRVLDEAHENARALVTEHRELLEDFARALLDRETLDAAEIGALDAGEELPPLASPDDEDEGEAPSPSAASDDVSVEQGATDDDVVVEEEPATEGTVPDGPGDEASGAEEPNLDTVRTPVVRLGAEDPEAGASS